jgi:hypothetical protein
MNIIRSIAAGAAITLALSACAELPIDPNLKAAQDAYQECLRATNGDTNQCQAQAAALNTLAAASPNAHAEAAARFQAGMNALSNMGWQIFAASTPQPR